MTTWETAWWDRWPGRLEYELNALEASGYRLLAEDRSTGLVALKVLAPAAKTGIGEVPLTVTFPDGYPHTAPRVTAPDLGMAHHQGPFGGTLCLLGRETKYWTSTDTAAALLDAQLAKAIAAGRAAPGTGVDELDQAEPFASYYPYAPAAEFLLAGAIDDVTPGQSGKVEFVVSGPFPPTPQGPRFIGLVEEVRDVRRVLHRCPDAVAGLFGSGGVRVTGRWVMLDGPVRSDDPAELWRAAADADAEDVPVAAVDGRMLQLRAVGFPDEISRTEHGTSWVVVIRETAPPNRQQSRPKKRGVSGHPGRAAAQLQPRTQEAFHVARVDLVGAEDLTARSPLTAPTADRPVLVIGCGAIGSVLVDHLVRAGVGRFKLVDRDVLEPGNLTRHAATLQHTGLNKTIAMGQHVHMVNPRVEVEVLPMPVGLGTATADGRLSSDLLADMVAQVDLVIDASAEVGIEELTADMARRFGVPWLMLQASEGAAGGTVVLVDPDADWCFACFQWHRAERTIPTPVAVGDLSVQPVGCAEPTFVGAGFDLAEVSLQAARTAVGRLLRDTPNGYGEDGHDAWVLTMRDGGGGRVPPHWHGYTVERHPSCRAHKNAE